VTPLASLPVEVIGWPTRFVGGDGAHRRVLRGLSARFPDLAAALWHGDDLGEHIEILVNDAVLGIDHTLDSPLAPGDRIMLLAQFMGGR